MRDRMSIIHERWGASFKEEVDASGIVRCDYVLYCWSAEGSLGSFKLNSCDLPVCSTSFGACRGSRQRFARSRDIVGVGATLSADLKSMDTRMHGFLELHTSRAEVVLSP